MERRERPVDERKNEDGDDQHEEDKGRAAAIVQAGRLFHVLYRELVAVFVAVDGLVLRAVVLIGLAQGLEQQRKEDIAQEDDEAETAVNEVVPDAPRTADGGRCVCDERRQIIGQEQKEREREHDAEDGGDDGQNFADGNFELFRHPLAQVGGLFLLCRERNVRGAHERAHAQHQRGHKADDPADKGQALPFRLLFGRREADRLRLHFAGVVTHGGCHAALAEHHDALDDGLPADMGSLCLFPHN